MVYSWGKDLDFTGILGISKGTHDLPTPCPLHSLIDYSIKSIQLSENKAWAIDSKGKLFIWGSYDTTQRNSWANILTNNIIIPQPLLVDTLTEYFIIKATPFSFIAKDNEFGLNICFKTKNNNTFGVIMGYNPQSKPGRKEVFHSSAS